MSRWFALLSVTSGGSALLAQAVDGGSGLGLDTIVQTGVTGSLAVVLLAFARTTHAQAVARADRNEQRANDIGEMKAAYEREAARADREAGRADRLEAKLDELNRTVLDRYAGALAEAARAVADATNTLSKVR